MVCPVSQIQFLAVMNGAPPALASPVKTYPAAGAVGNATAQEAAVAGFQCGRLFCGQMLKGLEVVIKLKTPAVIGALHFQREAGGRCRGCQKNDVMSAQLRRFRCLRSHEK